jgi:hypothetical protein
VNGNTPHTNPIIPLIRCTKEICFYSLLCVEE